MKSFMLISFNINLLRYSHTKILIVFQVQQPKLQYMYVTLRKICFVLHIPH